MNHIIYSKQINVDNLYMYTVIWDIIHGKHSDRCNHCDPIPWSIANWQVANAGQSFVLALADVGIPKKYQCQVGTPQKINMSPRTRPFQKELSSSNH